MSDKSTNSVGAAYLAVNFLGWATGKTPWQAMAFLNLNLENKRPKIGSQEFFDQTVDVSLYYLPDESKFKGTNYFGPVDESGEPYGVPLYCASRNDQFVKTKLERLVTIPSADDLSEMLTALKELHTCHRAFSSSEDWTSLDDEVRATVEAVIAKAEGTQSTPIA